MLGAALEEEEGELCVMLELEDDGIVELAVADEEEIKLDVDKRAVEEDELEIWKDDIVEELAAVEELLDEVTVVGNIAVTVTVTVGIHDDSDAKVRSVFFLKRDDFAGRSYKQQALPLMLIEV
jgi:hypothetical protein